MTTSNEQRRMVSSRNTRGAHLAASWLNPKAITPNQISLASIAFAAISFFSFILIPVAYAYANVLMLFAVAGMQLRLVCNLLDGMVAIEGGKKTASGELFNDAPDRVSDILIFVGAGYSVTAVEWGISLGWLVAVFAMLTAYVRLLAMSMGQPANFQGPMAKQHRMAVLTAACLLASIEYLLGSESYSILAGLLIIAIGSLITIFRRLRHAYNIAENT
jgi:phosphatidylglycerophosphate synthase